MTTEAMTINIYAMPVAQQIKSSAYLLAAAEGFKRHGLNANILPIHNRSKCDLAVCWGVRNGAAQNGQRALIFERGFLGDRYHWTSIGYDGLNGYGDYCNAHSPADRFEKYWAKDMKPWRDDVDRPVLLAGQLRGDASLSGLDNDAWCLKVKALLERDGPFKVIHRAHPLSAVGKVQNAAPLTDALKDAAWLVTYSSNSAVEAVFNGVPAVTVDPCCMAYFPTGHDLLARPPKPDRTQWARDLAYCQWAPEEIANGDFWEHLKKGMDQ
jgi:hypothetical protein